MKCITSLTSHQMTGDGSRPCPFCFPSGVVTEAEEHYEDAGRDMDAEEVRQLVVDFFADLCNSEGVHVSTTASAISGERAQRSLAQVLADWSGGSVQFAIVERKFGIQCDEEF